MKLAFQLIGSAALILALSSVLSAQQSLTPQQRRLQKIQSRIEAYQEVDSHHVVISNAEGSPVMFRTRNDTTAQWQVWRLGPGQTEPFPADSIISLLTQRADTTLAPDDHSYKLKGGQKYVIYWNQDYWDLIRVGDQESHP